MPRQRVIADRAQPKAEAFSGKNAAGISPGFSLIRFLILVQFKNLLDFHLEQPGDLERQRQAWIVFLRFDGVHRLARDVELVGQVRLRPFLRRAQFAQFIFHLKRRVKIIVPSM